MEVGAGREPHIGYLKHDYDEYFIAETSSSALEFYKEKKNIKNSFHWKSMKMRFLKIKKQFPLKTRPNAKAEFFSDFFLIFRKSL